MAVGKPRPVNRPGSSAAGNGQGTNTAAVPTGESAFGRAEKAARLRGQLGGQGRMSRPGTPNRPAVWRGAPGMSMNPPHAGAGHRQRRPMYGQDPSLRQNRLAPPGVRQATPNRQMGSAPRGNGAGKNPAAARPVLSMIPKADTPLKILSAAASLAPLLGVVKALPQIKEQGSALLSLYQMIQNGSSPKK